MNSQIHLSVGGSYILNVITSAWHIEIRFLQLTVQFTRVHEFGFVPVVSIFSRMSLSCSPLAELGSNHPGVLLELIAIMM